MLDLRMVNITITIIITITNRLFSLLQHESTWLSKLVVAFNKTTSRANNNNTSIVSKDSSKSRKRKKRERKSFRT